MLTLINKQYLTTLVITSGGNADQPRVPDYLNGVRYLISTPNHRAKKQDFQGYLTFLREHGKVAEVEFGMNILHNGDL
jgi:hypothetical protein